MVRRNKKTNKNFKKIPITIGISAHNEAANIGRMLDSILSQKLHKVSISEIIIISSGSTDGTNKIINKYQKQNLLIKLVIQKKRNGKASAVNLLLSKAKENIIILAGADILLAQQTLEKLVLPLKKSKVGIVGSHPVPLNNKTTFWGFSAHLMWDLHHLISLQNPKMGECIAFRKAFTQIPVLSSVDEVNIELLIKAQGYQAVYVPKAVIYNKGAENLKEFLSRRRHIYAGHSATLKEYGYGVSTISGTNILLLLLKNFQFNWRFIFWTPLVILLEIYGRILGYTDYLFGLKKHTLWEITPTTKQLPITNNL